jgi:hypothetical protein
MQKKSIAEKNPEIQLWEQVLKIARSNVTKKSYIIKQKLDKIYFRP